MTDTNTPIFVSDDELHQTGEHALQHEGNDISLSMILSQLFFVRWYLLIVPAVFTVVVVGLFLLVSNYNLPPVTYYVELKTTDGKYPNGAQFSPDDFKLPEVLARLGEKYGLDPNAELDEALFVSFGSPATFGTTKKYKALMSRRGLSATEIDDLNNKFATELAEQVNRTVRIEINYRKLGISKSTAKNMAIALPRIYSEVMSTNYRVFLDTEIFSVSTGSLGKLDTPAGIFTADRSIQAIRSGLSIISEDARFNLLTIGNRTASDMQVDLQNFEIGLFRPLYRSIIVVSDIVTRSYIGETKLQLRELEEEIAGVDVVLEKLKQFIQPSQNPGRGNAGLASGSSVQIDAAGISEIVTLGKQASFSEYLTATFDNRLELNRKIQDLKTRLARFQGEGHGLNEAHRLAAEKQLADIFNNYNALAGAAKTKAKADFNTFYLPLGIPVSQAGFDFRMAILLALAGCFVGLGIVVLAAMSGLFLAASAKIRRR